MDSKTVICLIIILILIILIVYYYYNYIDQNDNTKKKIPYDILYKNNITIVDMFKIICEKYGRYPAFKLKDDKIITYSKYYDRTIRFAEKLLYHIGPHSKIGILANNCPEWYYVFFGSMTAKCIPIGLNDNNPSYDLIDLLVVGNVEQLEKLRDIKMPSIKIILLLDVFDNNNDILSEYYENMDNKYDVKQEYNENMDNKYDDKQEYNENNLITNIKQNNNQISIIQYDVFVNKDISTYQTKTTIEFGKIYPENIATIIYTNGTTDKPKPITIYHKNITELIKSFVNIMISRSNISLNIQETFISYMSLNQSIIQFTDIYLPLLCVGMIHFSDNLDNDIQKIQPTIFVGTSKTWYKFYDRLKENHNNTTEIVNKIFAPKIDIGLSNVKYCININSHLSNDVKTFFNNLGIEICNIYGMTETVGIISIGVPSCSKGVGIPIVNIKIDSKTNEIIVKGGNVVNKHNKINEWFMTGDIGYIDRDETLYVTGRKNDIYVTKAGEKIQLNIIENQLLDELNREICFFDHVISYVENNKIMIMLIPSKKYDMTICDNSFINKTLNYINENNNITINNNYQIIDDTLSILQNCMTQTNNIKRDNFVATYKK